MPERKKFSLKRALELRRKGLSFKDIAKLIGSTPLTVKKRIQHIPDIKADDKIIEEISAEEKPKKKPTKPWDSVGNPWAPDIFRLRGKHSGFVPRFVDPGNIERREFEGYQIANAKDWEENTKETEGSMGTRLVRRGMVLMEMPEEIMQEKRKYIDRKTDNQNPTMQRKRIIAESKEMGRQSRAEFDLHEE